MRVCLAGCGSYACVEGVAGVSAGMPDGSRTGLGVWESEPCGRAF